MKLNDLAKKNIATKALKENFSMKFDVHGLDRAKTRTMLTKVTTLIKESKKSSVQQLILKEHSLLNLYQYL